MWDRARDAHSHKWNPAVAAAMAAVAATTNDGQMDGTETGLNEMAICMYVTPCCVYTENPYVCCR